MVLTTIGKPVPRIEGAAKVTGGERYAADITLPGSLIARVLRSAVPHARLRRVDASRARALPGVHAVLTGADIPTIFVGQRLKDMPILAVDRVRFAGEAIAAVAAETAEIADEALGLIEVDYEELPAVFDPIEAMAPGAPILHDDPSQYKNAPELPAGVPNLQGYNLLERGDLDAAFAQADRVFEHTFRTQLTHHGYLEPHACVARVNADRTVEVWASNKWPYVLRNWLAEDLGIPASQIKVHILSVGGDFGGKAGLLDVPLCVLLAQRADRPVKLVLTYAEELQSAARRHPAVITLRTGVRNDGTLVAIHAQAVFGGGGYGAFKMSPQVTVAGARQVASCYRVPAIRIENSAVYTNHPPCTQTRSPGGPQVNFAVESQMDLIARELGMDPVEFRLKNLLREGDASPLGQKWEHIRVQETLERAIEASSWGQPKPSPHYGRGVAVYERSAASGKSSARIHIDRGGAVILDIGTPDVGPGIATVCQQIVAEALGVGLDRVRVRADDTDSVPYDAGTGGSKSTNSTGHAAHRAALEARDALTAVAAQRLGCTVEQVRIEEGRFVGPDGRDVPLGEAAAAASGGDSYSRLVEFEPPPQPPVTSFCVQVAEVEVDPHTGQVQVRRHITAHDVGTIINDIAHQGQIDGGLVQGQGFALMVETPIEDGRVSTANLGDFKLPTTMDIPELTTVLLDNPTGPAPFHGKAIGEIPNVPTASAIANAVYDAIGVRIFELPIAPEAVIKGMRG